MDKERLLTPRLAQEDVEIPGVGTVRVRALTRAESLLVSSANEHKGPDVADCRQIAFGMVDPPMTEAEARQWRDATTFTEIQAILDVIMRLSGLDDGADKEAHKSLPDGSESEVRVLPGAEAGNDSGATSGTDE